MNTESLLGIRQFTSPNQPSTKPLNQPLGGGKVARFASIATSRMRLWHQLTTDGVDACSVGMRAKFGQDGDFMIYTDRLSFRLDLPIEVIQ